MSSLRDGEPIEILLVEDNPGDVRLTEKAFEEGSLANDLDVVTDGVEAMRYLRQDGEYAEKTLPDIVLLDLNLPKKNGDEVLEDIKTDDDLKHLPVVILTSSEAEEDIAATYNKHANAYLTKPVDFDGFTDIVNQIEGFWFRVVRLPSE
jgi:chemotaxis family two-component system response regulator Rcp1